MIEPTKSSNLIGTVTPNMGEPMILKRFATSSICTALPKYLGHAWKA